MPDKAAVSVCIVGYPFWNIFFGRHPVSLFQSEGLLWRKGCFGTVRAVLLFLFFALHFSPLSPNPALLFLQEPDGVRFSSPKREAYRKRAVGV